MTLLYFYLFSDYDDLCVLTIVVGFGLQILSESQMLKPRKVTQERETRISFK